MSELNVKTYPNVAQSFGITGIVVLTMLLFSPVNILLNGIIGKEASMFVYYILAVGIPFWIVLMIKKNNTEVSAFNFRIENKQVIPLVIIGTTGLLFGVTSPIVELIPMPEVFKKAFMEVAGQSGIFSFVTLVIAAPVFEELIFRGIILDGLLQKYTPAKSIIVSSLLFGLVHLNPWQFVAGFMIGMFSGWIYYQTRSLFYSMIIHATNNMIGFSQSFFFNPKDEITSVDLYGGLTNYILVIIGSVIITLVCVRFLNNIFDQIKQTEEDQKFLTK